MPYVTFETMENEETTNLAEKSTILDGRRRRRRRRGNIIKSILFRQICGNSQ